MARQELQGLHKVGEFAIFFQEQGSNPADKPRYRGATQFGGWNTPLGDITPQYIQNPDRPNDWIVADVTQAAPGLPNTDMTARVNDELFRIWERIKKARCPINVQVKFDDCGAADDLNSWKYKNIYVRTYLTDFTRSLIAPVSGDDQAAADLTGSFTALRELTIFPLTFEIVADAAILSEVVAGFYAGKDICGGKCGNREDLSYRLYVLTRANSGSPGLSSQLVFSIDGKQTWNTLDIATLGGVSANDMVKMGQYIIVVSENTASHHYISIADAEAEDPTAWEEISTNYVGGVLCAYNHSASETYLGGVNGYAYKLEDPTTEPTVLTDGSITTEHLTHVSGWGSTVVFAGNNGKVLVSNNSGESLSLKPITLADGTVITANVTALDLFGTRQWFVAAGNKLYFTNNNGDTYSEKGLDASVTIITDIKFVNEACGWLVTQNSGGTNKVYRTDSSGALWSPRAPYISGLPTADRYLVAIPCDENEVAVGGRVAVGGDGILAVAT